MSIVKNYPFISHYQGAPTSFVVHLKHGRAAHTGTGQSFWFRRATAAISEVPVVDQELPIIFHAYTSDHQDVSVQITVTYRFTGPQLASERLEFGTFPQRSGDAVDGQAQATTILTRLAQSVVVADIGTRNLNDVLGGLDTTRTILAQGFADNERLSEIGLTVVDLHVLAIRPEADVEKALQTPLREQIQATADRATFERRAQAVESERAISENELASKIELAIRAEQLVAQEGANARRQAEELAAAELIKTNNEAERRRISAEAEAESVRVTGQARADSTGALMASYSGIDKEILGYLALRDLAQGLPHMNIEHLAITPDLVSKFLSRLGG